LDTGLNEDAEDAIMQLLPNAERAMQRMKAGERPDVPWIVEDVVDEAWCDKWLVAIESWRNG
jgi:hypothetical protein